MKNQIMSFFGWLVAWYRTIKDLKRRFDKWPTWKKFQFLDTFVLIGLFIFFIIYGVYFIFTV